MGWFLMIGEVAIILSALTYSLYIFLNRKVEYNFGIKLFWQILIALPIILIIFGHLDMSSISSLDIDGWLKILALVFIVTLGGYGFMLLSIKKVGATITGVLDYSEPILAIIMAMLLFNEELSTIQIFGWVLIIFTLFNINKIRTSVL